MPLVGTAAALCVTADHDLVGVPGACAQLLGEIELVRRRPGAFRTSYPVFTAAPPRSTTPQWYDRSKPQGWSVLGWFNCIFGKHRPIRREVWDDGINRRSACGGCGRSMICAYGSGWRLFDPAADGDPRRKSRP